jgi:hypothetical protein
MELGGLWTIGSAFFFCEVGEVDWVSRPEIQSWRNRVIRDYKAPVPRQERSNAGYRMIRRPMSFRAPEHNSIERRESAPSLSGDQQHLTALCDSRSRVLAVVFPDVSQLKLHGVVTTGAG